jgi:hypothetical protein
LFALIAIALTIKLCLQAASVIPSLSRLAFGFRPIVIGYLHLVLLGVISLFIITYILSLKLIRVNRPTTLGFVIFTLGIVVNEFLLMIQGAGDLGYTDVPSVNFLLFLTAIVLFSGALIANAGQINSGYDFNHKEAGYID